MMNTVRMILIASFLYADFANAQRKANVALDPVSIRTSSLTAFGFDPITGILAAGQTVTATASGHFPTFAVVISGDTQPPLTIATQTPAPGDVTGLEPYTFTVPSTLGLGEFAVLLEYTGADGISGTTMVGAIAPVVTSSSAANSSPTSDSSGGSTSNLASSTMPDMTTAISSTATSSTAISSTATSSTMPAISTSISSFPSTATSATTPTTTATSTPPTTPTNATTSTNSMTLASSSSQTTAPIGSEEKSPKTKNLGAIVGGTIGAAVVALLVLLALLWCKRRKRQTTGRPMTFHGDMMVKSPEPTAPSTFTPFTTRSARPSRSVASSRNSSIDSQIFTEKTPALAVHSRAVRSRASKDGQGDNGEGLYRYPSSSSSSMAEYESARGPSRLSPRTDRQMELEEKIQILKAEMISLSDELSGGSSDSHDSQIGSIRAKIKRLERLESSDWALSLTDDVPNEFLS